MQRLVCSPISFRFSLGSFLALFEKTLRDPAAGSSNPSVPGSAEARIAALRNRLMEVVVEFVSRALFNK